MLVGGEVHLTRQATTPFLRRLESPRDRHRPIVTSGELVVSKMSLNDIYGLLHEIQVIDEQKLMAFQAHGLRVMRLACMLGRQLGVFDDDLRVAALLHDIGKIGIDSAILFKPGPLTSTEYLIVQAHCHIGNRILRDKLNLPRAAEFVRDHHERHDGTGYPRGIAGDQISLQAQIIHLCDTFDTMTAERRVYQAEPLSVQEGLNEIRRCGGHQFHPTIAREFVSMIRNSALVDNRHRWYQEAAMYRPLTRQPKRINPRR